MKKSYVYIYSQENKMIEYTVWLEENQSLKKIADKGSVDISKIDVKELQMGMKVEEEHSGKMGKDTDVTGGDPVKVLKIAVAHLREDPKYYTKLKKIEGEH